MDGGWWGLGLGGGVVAEEVGEGGAGDAGADYADGGGGG